MNHLNWLLLTWRSSGSTPSFFQIQVYHPFFKSKNRHPVKETYCDNLILSVIADHWGLRLINQLLNQELCLNNDSPIQCPHYSWCSTNLFEISCSIPWLRAVILSKPKWPKTTMTEGEGWNVNRPVNPMLGFQAQVPLQHNSLVNPSYPHL